MELEFDLVLRLRENEEERGCVWDGVKAFITLSILAIRRLLDELLSALSRFHTREDYG